MKKVIRKLHLWLSIPAGLFITLICLTGALMVFQDEIRLVAGHRYNYTGSSEAERLPLEELSNRVQAEFPEKIKIVSAEIHNDPKRSVKFTVKAGEGNTEVFIDPYTGHVLKLKLSAPDFFDHVRELHRWLLLKGKNRPAGKSIVGYATLSMVILSISGLVIWWPRNRKVLKKRLSFRFRSGRKHFWYDMHVAGGGYALLLVLVMALTGLTYSFTWYKQGFYKCLGVTSGGTANVSSNGPSNNSSSNEPAIDAGVKRDGEPDRAGNKNEAVPDKEGNDLYSSWDTAFKAIKEESAYPVRHVKFQNATVTVTYDKLYGSSRGPDRFSIDKKTGGIKSVKRFADQSKVNRLNAYVYSFHVGEWLGIWSKFFYLIASLTGAFLPVTGYYIYLRRYFKKRKAAAARI